VRPNPDAAGLHVNDVVHDPLTQGADTREFGMLRAARLAV
jgi:hypothetical protein